MPSDFFFTSVERRRPREQDHEVRVLDARDPDLLPVDDVAVALFYRGGPDLGGVGPGGRFGDAHRLQPQLATRDLRQVCLLLRLGAVPQQRAHVVHLAVAGAGVAAAAVDLLHDDRRLGEPEARSAVVLWNQRREPARLRQRRRRILRDSRALSSTRRKYSAGNSAQSARIASRISGCVSEGFVMGPGREMGWSEAQRAAAGVKPAAARSDVRDFMGIVRERRLRDVIMTETFAPFGGECNVFAASMGFGCRTNMQGDAGYRLRLCAVRTAMRSLFQIC